MVRGHAPYEARATIEAEALGAGFEPRTVGPVTSYDRLDGGLAERVEQELDPLGAVEPPDGEDEAPVLLAAVGQLLRWVREDIGLQPSGAREPLRVVVRRREQRVGLAEGRSVKAMDRTPGGAVDRPLAELTELSAVQLVRLAELVHEPDDLPRVSNHVGGELRRDHYVDGRSVRLLEIDQPPERGLGQHARSRVPLEGKRYQSRVVLTAPELLDELVREDFGASALERDLWQTDRNPHV